MLKKEDWVEIRTQVERGVYKKDVAEQLGVHPRTVSRALERGGAPTGRKSVVRGSKLDPFKPVIDGLLREGVWNAMVILREIQARGYTGGTSILRAYIHPKRPLRRSRATVRFETGPGEQLQNDWGELITTVAGTPRKVFFNVSTLGFSRRFFFWCSERNDSEHTYEGLIRAFEYFGGATREVLVDNLKAAVISHRIGESVRFNDRFIDLAGHYGFVPKACRPRRARTKGKDERMVGYAKHHFFVRYREFESFDQMNELAEQWLRDEADKRLHGTVKEIVIERFGREAPHLKALPVRRYDTSYVEHRSVHWDGYIDVLGNRYSVPSEYCGQTVRIRIRLDGELRVYAGESVVAEHTLRSAGEGWVKVPSHHAELWRDALRVQRRDLSVYEEVGRWN